MRDDAHLHSHIEQQARPLSRDIPWMLAFAAVLAFDIVAMAGWIR
jgi:hypothetical protein